MEVVMARKEVFKSPADKARWLSEFLSADIDKMTEPEFYKLFLEFWLFVTHGGLGVGLIMTEVTDQFHPLAIETRADIKEAQSVVSDILSQVVTWRDSSKNQQLGFVAKNFPVEFKVRVQGDSLSLDNKEDANLLWFAVLELLSQFSLSWIRKCANEPCGNFFVQSTKREKIYCSQRCAWQQTARQARRDKGDKYREKQRKVMYERYPEEQKKKHGQNVKVHRRKK